jgi:hypothetical protein
MSRSFLSNVELGRRSVTGKVESAYMEALGMDRRSFLQAATAAPLSITFADLLDDRRTIDEWSRAVDGYGRRYLIEGSARLRVDLAGDLNLIQGRLDTPAAIEQAAHLAVWYALSIADLDQAKTWYRLANALADQAGPSISAYIAGRTAIALAYDAADPSIADILAQKAVTRSRPRTPARLFGLTAAAHIQAIRGSHAEAARAMVEVERVFHQSPEPNPRSDRGVPAWRHYTFASMLWGRLGDLAKAEEARAVADSVRPPEFARFAAHTDMHTALALARSGDRTAAITHADAVLGALPADQQFLSLLLMRAEVEGKRQ